MNRLQVREVTFQIVTKAERPLELDEATMAKLVEGLDRAVRNNVDLRYGRTIDGKRHEYVGVMVK